MLKTESAAGSTAPSSTGKAGAAGPAVGQTRKKMYRNCDNCRSAKRGCDATYTTIAQALASKVACTNCKKKGQVCTFNSLINAFGGIPLGGLTGAAFAESLQEAASLSKRKRSDSQDSTSSTVSSSSSASSSSSSPLSAAQISALPKDTDSDRRKNLKDVDAESGVDRESKSFKEQQDGDSSEVKSMSNIGGADDSHSPKKRRKVSNASTSASTSSSSSGKANTSSTLVLSRHQSPFPAPASSSHRDIFEVLGFDIWGTSPNVRLSDSVDRLHLNDDLLNVYQGAAESAFRVWVTNNTTPYLLSNDSFNNSSEALALNQKVCVLDRASKRFFKSSGASESAEKRISEAYHAVLLAYAAQWPRHRQDHHSTVSRTDWKPDEARIRLSLWKRARDKLMDAADAWSFRIIFALILFAWTEKPKEVPDDDHWNKEEMEPLSHLNPPSLDENSALDSSSWQGPAEASTMMLATAMRKLKSFRTKIQELNRRGIDPWSTDDPDLGSDEVARRHAEAELLEKTYHNLFWLGVMMDTEIAVLRKHDPVISDEDTDLADQGLFPHRAQPSGGGLLTTMNDDIGFGSSRKPMRKIWDEVIPANSQKNKESFVKCWPCSEEDALRTLAYATPIKVLLFRHVGRLQASYWRQSSSEQIERQITHVLSVIRHWDETFAPFFASCITNHAKLPPSVQSWYTITLTKWNLAAILLVELVHSVDRSAASPFQNTEELFEELRSKVSNQTAALIHAIQHCSLAKATQEYQAGSGSSHHSAPSRSPSSFDFIEATDSTILHTDPWTEITVHCFTAVAKSEIRTFSKLASQNKWQELQCSEHRVEKCIWALEQLCNRSTLADDACTEMKRLLHTHSPFKQQSVIDAMSMGSGGGVVSPSSAIEQFLAETQHHAQSEVMDVDPTANAAASHLAPTSMPEDVWQSCLDMLNGTARCPPTSAPGAVPIPAHLSTADSFGMGLGNTPSGSLSVPPCSESFLWPDFTSAISSGISNVVTPSTASGLVGTLPGSAGDLDMSCAVGDARGGNGFFLHPLSAASVSASAMAFSTSDSSSSSTRASSNQSLSPPLTSGTAASSFDFPSITASSTASAPSTGNVDMTNSGIDVFPNPDPKHFDSPSFELRI